MGLFYAILLFDEIRRKKYLRDYFSPKTHFTGILILLSDTLSLNYSIVC